MVNEECWVVVGFKLFGYWVGYRTKHTDGTPVSVGFDIMYVIKNMKKIVGFYHTHPCTARPSMTDYRAMRGMCVATGKPLLCAIKGTDGLKGHWFIDDGSPHVTMPIHQYRNLLFGRVPNRFDIIKSRKRFAPE